MPILRMAKIDKKTVNYIFTKLGLITITLLIILSGLSWYGYKFITDSVRNELTSQKIYFPAKDNQFFSPTEFPDIQKYAGQIVDDGPKSKAYADSFIKKHLEKIGGGKTYSEISAASLADPTNEVLTQQTQLMFRGTTLRGMLLTSGYGYWTMGIIAMYISVASLIGAGMTAIVVLLGMRKIKNRK